MKAAIFKRFEQSCWISNKLSSVTISCLRLKCFIWHNNSGSSYRRDWFWNISEMFFVCLFFKAAHPSSRTPVAIKTPGVWFFLWSSGRTPSILHFIVCLSPAVSLQQCHSSLRCISSLQLCLVTGMKLGLHATVICWRKLQAIRSWTLRTSRLRSPPTSG